MSEGWRDIGSAPKDGTRFLARHAAGPMTLAEVTGLRFNDHPDNLHDWDCYAVGLRCSTQERLADFTHWQPLPLPPA